MTSHYLRVKNTCHLNWIFGLTGGVLVYFGSSVLCESSSCDYNMLPGLRTTTLTWGNKGEILGVRLGEEGNE